MGKACSCGVRVLESATCRCAPTSALHRSLECRPVVCAGPTPASASGVKMVMGEGLCFSAVTLRREIGGGGGRPFPSTTPLRARMISWVPRFSVSLNLSLLYMKERRYEHSHLRERKPGPQEVPRPRSNCKLEWRASQPASLPGNLPQPRDTRVVSGAWNSCNRVGPGAGRAARPGPGEAASAWLMLPLGYCHLLSYQGSAAHKWQGRAPLAQLC